MSENREFAREYRSGLARELLKEQEREERRRLLEKARLTLDYRLARAEKRALSRGVDFLSPQILRQRELQEESPPGGMESHFVSNEGSLYKLFPYLDGLSGAVLGVGTDQVLDIFVNSKATHAFVVDYTELNSLITRALLEVGSYHRKVFGQSPSREGYIEYFQDENLHQLARILGLKENFSRVEVAKIVKLLERGIRVHIDGTLERVSFSEYQAFKSRMKDDKGEVFSWLGTKEHIDKALKAYEEGKIYVIKGDLTNAETMGKVAEEIEELGIKINILYWSNIERYFYGHEDVCSSFFEGVTRLPIGKDAVILRTAWGVRGLEEVPQPEAVRQDEKMSHILHSWHYNIQRYSDWHQKVMEDKDGCYLAFKGWVSDIMDGIEAGSIQNTGVSALGF